MAKVVFWLPSFGEPPFWAPTDGFSPGVGEMTSLETVLQKQKYYFVDYDTTKQTEGATTYR